MNIKQDKDLAIKFDAICRKLRESGADLSRIKIVMERGSTASYVTKRILMDLEGRAE